MIGTRVVRKEDPDLLTGEGRFVGDIAPVDALHVTFVRSIMAHARLTEVDTSQAKGFPGVVAVLTAADLDLQPQTPDNPMLNQTMLRTWLATDRVRFVGEPIAVIVSETREGGVDAAEQVFVDYEPLDVVVSVQDSATEETLLFPGSGTNTTFALPSAVHEDIFAECEARASLSYRNHR
ncbi:MAG: xanthine dehydrogenase family protein molybdopterin-binding subunit, partial [Actinomycetia bacterium]|nr:xanthine dehydrogenase family protein molybdopterin-binding subunit [Actinomycetes bacterium]